MKYRFPISIRTFLAVAAVASFAAPVFAQNPRPFPSPGTAGRRADTNATTTASTRENGGQLNSTDKGFVKDAAKGGMMEVAMGRVAEQNSSNADVKSFGGRMVRDHSKANNELKALAKQKNVELPPAPSPEKWKSDKDYMGMMVKDHEKDLDLFQNEAKNGGDADLKRFADKTAATVRKHLDMAKEINGKLK